MPDITYNSLLEDVLRGNINFATDTFYLMLVTSGYVPDQDTHLKRSDVTSEATGTGYTAGGKPVTITITKDLVNNRVDLALSNVTWNAVSITARGAVVYKRRGGAATADELVLYGDFGTDKVATAGDLIVSATVPLRFANT